MSLLKHLEILEDPRSDINKKHNLLDVVFLVLSAVLSGASGWKSIQEFGEEQLDRLKKHRPFENGIPKRHCIANIIKALDSELLLVAIMNWLNEVREGKGKTILALDGKTMRAAFDNDVQKALHVVSAFDVKNGVAFYQQATDRKGKEPEVVRNMIKVLALENTVITLDALHCQSKTMNEIVAQKGDFLIQLKGNRKELNDTVDALFQGKKHSRKKSIFEQRSLGHGRVEYRKVTQIAASFEHNMKEKWPHIKTLIEVESKREVKGQKTRSIRRYVSSLMMQAEEAAQMIREHWAIENKLHWVLDVVFREDNLKIKDPDGAMQLAIFNRAALNIIKQHQGKKDSMAAKRRRAAWSPDFRTELLLG